MAYTKTTQKKTEVELTITVIPSEYQKQLERAAERLSLRGGIKGFRPGKVPFEIMKREVGEMTILQEALEAIIRESFVAAVQEEKLETIGMPNIQIEKMAPGNEIVYKATVSLLPQVRVADFSSVTITKSEKSIDEKKIDETIQALRGMQANETAKTGPAQGTDKLIIDMNMTLDKVPVEGGVAKDYQVYLGEEHYVPGFNKELVGLTTGEEKMFSLVFPEGHYQKMLAGKNVEFSVKVKSVFERQLPEVNDEFAKKIGQPSLEELRNLIRKNLESEAKKKAEQETEIALFDALIEKSSFEEIPDVLLDAERQKMFFELKRDLESNGVSIEHYLQDIKKDEKQLFEDFKAQAEKRAKAALLSRTIAKTEGLAPTEDEITKEINFLKENYKDQPEYLENLKKPEVRDTIASMIQNRKVIAFLKEKILIK